MNLKTGVALFGLLVLTAGVAHGQSSGRPWLAVGLGSGTYSLDGGGGQWGLLGHVGLRLAVSQTLLLGVEASILLREGDSTHSVFGGMAHLYPSATTGLFVKAGFGVARLHRSPSGGQSAGALLWGLGHDIGVSEKLSLTPFIDGGLQPYNAWWQFGIAVSLR